MIDAELRAFLHKIKLSQHEADAIRQRFYRNSAWPELAKEMPKWAKALEALPNTNILAECNIMFCEMIFDAITEAQDEADS